MVDFARQPMSHRTILTIEDDPAIRRGIVDALQFSGYRVLQSGTVAQGLALAAEQTYDLLLLDVVLPDGSGLEILAEVREKRPRQPVIMLTARGDERDRVAGLQMGADDYVVKPFSVRELLARIDAVLRRAGPVDEAPAPILLRGRGTIDFAAGELQRPGGERVELSPRESQLIRYLSANGGRAISREEILQNVWGLDARGVTTRTIDMHIARLREKLGDSPAEPEVIVTVRGRGYLWRT